MSEMNGHTKKMTNGVKEISLEDDENINEEGNVMLDNKNVYLKLLFSVYIHVFLSTTYLSSNTTIKKLSIKR